MAPIEHSETPAAGSATRVVADLQRSVQSLMDADRVLPADGLSLLAALEQALAGLTGENRPAARAGMEAFLGQVQALIEARMLAAEDGHPPIETAAAILVWLQNPDGIGG